jgi:hypothetical protein
VRELVQAAPGGATPVAARPAAFGLARLRRRPSGIAPRPRPPRPRRPAGAWSRPPARSSRRRPSTWLPSSPCRKPWCRWPTPAARTPAALDQPSPEWPPSTRLSYTLTGHYRGPVQGQAQVEWLRSGTRYQVHMDLSVGPSFAPLMARASAAKAKSRPLGLRRAAMTKSRVWRCASRATDDLPGRRPGAPANGRGCRGRPVCRTAPASLCS